MKSSKAANDKRLLIVESPTKARTIGKYLGNSYEVVATVGHLRDLPKNKMGVDLMSFEVDYVVEDTKKKVVEELRRKATGANLILLATDPDREGEAISWHVDWILKNSKTKKLNPKTEIKRITFHEITKEAVEEAVANPRAIDIDLVNAQQARRVLDRVVAVSYTHLTLPTN
jgi:DNA topoisomerase-1